MPIGSVTMPEHKLQVDEVFDEALRRAAGPDRDYYLDEACGSNLELRRRVERLLRAVAEAGSFLEAPAQDPSPTVDQPLVESPGTVIGPYKLIEQISEGGMGTVWMAQQTEPVRRVVALKLIKAGMDSKQVIARFEAERQALALMDHPNIAKVFDGGTTGYLVPALAEGEGPTPAKAGANLRVGRPYFVMELVKGIPITKYCDGHHLTPRQRLELFVPVCQAVQHAHQKGIIHRDLKPSNVLVALYDGKPVPKVIDFGVAKAAGQSLTDKTLVTGFGNIVGTLEYMSPEQAEVNQLDIDTRSDIYSLGVLLYELLAGSPPFSRKELEKAGMLEMLRVIREQEPSKPSTKLSTAEGLPTLAANRGTEPAKLTKLMRGELDWIVMKALEKDRNRRYETANGFAMDVQRYLADEAVQACPPSVGYRFRKFARRNKGPVAAAVSILCVLVAGIAGTTFGFVRAVQAQADEVKQRQIADAEKKKAEQAEADTLADYRASTDDAIEQLIGSKPDLGPQEKAYLERTLKRWQAFAARQGDDQHSQAIRAEGHFRVGMLWLRLGRRDEARTEFEAARDLLKKLSDAFPDVPSYKQDLAGAHYRLGDLLRRESQRDAALTEYKTALDMCKKLANAFPEVPQHQQKLALTHNGLAEILRDLGRRDAALTEYKTALDLLKKLADAFPDVTDYDADLAETHHALGSVLKELGDPKAGRAEFETACGLYQKLATAFPQVPRYLQALASTHNSLGLLLADLRQHKAAREEYVMGCDLCKKLTVAFPAVPYYQVELGGGYGNLGHLDRDVGQPVDSLHWYDLAIRTLTPVYEKDRRYALAKLFLHKCHWGRALAYDQLEKHAEAVRDWDIAVEFSPESKLSECRAGRASSRVQAGQVAEAVAEVEELTKASKLSADEWYNFACVYAIASGKVADKKREYADRAMELLRRAVNDGFKDAAHVAKDTDLAPLRGRDDFKKLLTELEARQKQSGVRNQESEKKPK
jgi:serine/threonine protein kinase/tetratricopeptide (TPR) repeat protein